MGYCPYINLHGWQSIPWVMVNEFMSHGQPLSFRLQPSIRPRMRCRAQHRRLRGRRGGSRCAQARCAGAQVPGVSQQWLVILIGISSAIFQVPNKTSHWNSNCFCHSHHSAAGPKGPKYRRIYVLEVPNIYGDLTNNPKKKKALPWIPSLDM